MAARKRSKFGGNSTRFQDVVPLGCGGRKEKGIGWREGASRPAKPAAADPPFKGRKEGNHERTRIFGKRPSSQKSSLLRLSWYFFQRGECPHVASQYRLPFSQHIFLGLRQTISVAICRALDRSAGRAAGRSMGILAELSLRS